MFFLEIDDDRSSVEQPLRFEGGSITLGRDDSMDVVLDDLTVSRQSAIIIERDAQHYLQDLGGKNSVRVNDAVVVSHPLKDGDIISIGKYKIYFRTTEGLEPVSGEMVLDARKSLQKWKNAMEAPGKLSYLEMSIHGSQGVEKILAVLQAFAELIQRLPDREKLFEAALDPVFDLLDVKRCFIGLFNNENILNIVAEKNAGEPGDGGFSRSIVDRVRREKVAILFSDDGMTPYRHDSRSLVRLKIKSAMCVPIFRQEEVLGILYLDNRKRARSFKPGDLHFANILSHLISLAIDKESLYRRIHEENVSLKSILREKNQLVGVSKIARELNRTIRRLAAFEATVQIYGESGTGKELVARAMHDRSPRHNGPFVPVNCAAIPETLLESELFGYDPQSGISGANPEGKAGKFELAHGGTLFLDEIGDMSLLTQAKILRILEDHVVVRLGGNNEIPVDIRIITATNKSLDIEVAEARFREDLFYRLKVFQIQLRPLRERPEDILCIASHFIKVYGGKSEGEGVRISPRAQEAFLSYRWPGNIRELRNILQNALLMSNGKVIYPEDLPEEVSREENKRVFGSIAELEERHLKSVLAGVNWNKRKASEILGINRSTLYEKIRLYKIVKKGLNEDSVASALSSVVKKQ